MLSPQLRQQVNDLWTRLWSAGMTNPLTAIEQITYLIFLKRLETLDAERVRDGKSSIYAPRLVSCNIPHHPDEEPAMSGSCRGHETCRWSYIVQYAPVSDPEDPAGERMLTLHGHISRYVFPWLRELDTLFAEKGNGATGSTAARVAAPMDDAFFQFPPDKLSILQHAIEKIDELFAAVGTRSANDDLMGDIFEYLLSEIKTSGKNGQFRTPRHIIRFMLELLDPQPGKRMIDPSAGTGGFLTNAIQHLFKKATDPETLLLEWDGTPHRAAGEQLDRQQYLDSAYFTGYDNDRTMVRIGWMNMVLRGIDRPRFGLCDTLGESLPVDERGRYAYAFANPPFTGTVDKDDIHQNFPRNPRNMGEPITNKSELLFIWLILDLLAHEGRAAVIVPEGVLFGSTIAHKTLRRELLFKHCLEAVISLPAGVFQPYTGVKTSILVFQKVGQTKPLKQPQTDNVWFYEVAADGYTLDARRNDKREPNDLWDALAKWPERIAESTKYYQPTFAKVRWRRVDNETVQVFPTLAAEENKVWGNHELFFDVPADPDKATSQIVHTQTPRIQQLYQRYVALSEAEALQIASSTRNQKKVEDVLKKTARSLDSIFTHVMGDMLEGDSKLNRFAWKALDPLVKEASTTAVTVIRDRVLQAVSGDATDTKNAHGNGNDPARPTSGAEATDNSTSNGKRNRHDDTPDWQHEVEAIVREFAKLDGYDVMLRSLEVAEQTERLEETKSWSVPVRRFVQRDDWQSTDGTLKGSHDAEGNLRVEYLQDPHIYADKEREHGKPDYLDPDCLEANDYNLSAGRYKPFHLKPEQYDPPLKILEQLEEMESQIQERLRSLAEKIAGKA